MIPRFANSYPPEMGARNAAQKRQRVFFVPSEKRIDPTDKQHCFLRELGIVHVFSIFGFKRLKGAVPDRIQVIRCGGSSIKMMGVATHKISAFVADMSALFGHSVMQGVCNPVGVHIESKHGPAAHGRIAPAWRLPMPRPTRCNIVRFNNSFPKSVSRRIRHNFCGLLRILDHLPVPLFRNLMHGALLVNRTSVVNPV